VLAIAGLIILIVLLAVPALQRNGRNTAIKNDASAIAAAISEFKSNNDGAAPSGGTLSSSGATTFTIGSSSQNQAVAKLQPGTNVDNAFGSATSSWPTDAGHIIVLKDTKCNGTGAITGAPRAFAVIYNTEGSGSSLAKQCIDA